MRDILAVMEKEFGEEDPPPSCISSPPSCTQMRDILAVMEKEFGEEELDGRQEFESAKEEIKNKNSEEYNVLRFTLEGLIEELEKHFDSAHANYTATTEQRTIDFKSLTLKDQQRWAGTPNPWTIQPYPLSGIPPRPHHHSRQRQHQSPRQPFSAGPAPLQPPR
jgi:hypothetical protein